MTFAQLERGGDAVRRPARVAGAHRRGVRIADRAARGHLRGRWACRSGATTSAARSRSRPGSRCSPGCCSGASCGGRRCGSSSACWWRSGVVVGLVDLLRPADQRTHVGKFFEKAGTDFGSATLVLRRKASREPLGAPPLAAARLPHRGRVAAALPLVRAAEVARRRCSRGSRPRAPPRSALAVVAVLGFALNDSGITIPGMMAAVFVAALVFRAGRGSCSPTTGAARDASSWRSSSGWSRCASCAS